MGHGKKRGKQLGATEETARVYWEGAGGDWGHWNVLGGNQRLLGRPGGQWEALGVTGDNGEEVRPHWERTGRHWEGTGRALGGAGRAMGGTGRALGDTGR